MENHDTMFLQLTNNLAEINNHLLLCPFCNFEAQQLLCTPLSGTIMNIQLTRVFKQTLHKLFNFEDEFGTTTLQDNIHMVIKTIAT